MDSFENVPVLKISWGLSLVFVVVDVIMSLYTAAANDNNNGHKSSGFVAIWSGFLIVGFGVLGSRIIFSQKSTNLMVGFLLGYGAMLSQLFFALSIYYFLIANSDHEDGMSEDQEAANDSMGAFSIILSIALGCWTGVLYLKKSDLYLADLQKSNDKFDVPPASGDYDEHMINQSRGDI
jgi:hypothetical protein